MQTPAHLDPANEQLKRIDSIADYRLPYDPNQIDNRNPITMENLPEPYDKLVFGVTRTGGIVCTYPHEMHRVENLAVVLNQKEMENLKAMHSQIVENICSFVEEG